MMGGRDIIIPTTRGTETLALAVRAVTKLWPSAVLEDPDTDESFRHYAEIKFAGRTEILAFRDPESATRWETLGADPSLDGTLIHLLLSPSELTVAIDASPPPQIRAFVEDLRESLRQTESQQILRR